MLRLKHVLRAKAVLCPGLKVTFQEVGNGETEVWHYQDGLKDYLFGAVNGYELLPKEPFTGVLSGEKEAVDWAVNLAAGRRRADYRILR